ncbi:MAG: T9SS type A sorting domain-containing protein [Candidatus Cloacimonetes bacterium]|nr:T9SS type A sorting domain-containing protein [Candidatus Cloacimonadota bacterium]
MYSQLKFVLCLIVLLSAISLFGQFSGGMGTQSDPFIVATATELDSVRFHLDSCFLQVADIDLGTEQYSSGTGWQPLASYSTFGPFTGCYNGNGYTIGNLTINNGDNENIGYLSLFGSISNAQIVNVTLDNVHIVGRSASACLAGYAEYSEIFNCSVEGSVRGLDNCGGIVGYACYSTIQGCGTTISLFGRENVGGIAGDADGCSIIETTAVTAIGQARLSLGGISGFSCNGTEIIDCAASGSLYSTDNSGGIVGFGNDTLIERCRSDFDVIWGSMRSGGILAESRYGATIIDCSASASVEGWHSVGGIVGMINGQSCIIRTYFCGSVMGINNIGGLAGGIVFSSVLDCYANATVTGESVVGGFASSAGSALIGNCYSTGLLTCSDELIGGFIATGQNLSTYNCYWDIDTSQTTVSFAGNGRNTDQMTFPYDTNTYVDWDFAQCWANDTGLINGGYPILEHSVAVQDENLMPSMQISLCAYPNPFKESLNLAVSGMKGGEMQLKIYNIKGQLVNKQVIHCSSEGKHTFTWDCKNEHGRTVASGMYIIKVQSNSETAVSRVVKLH